MPVYVITIKKRWVRTSEPRPHREIFAQRFDDDEQAKARGREIWAKTFVGHEKEIIITRSENKKWIDVFKYTSKK